METNNGEIIVSMRNIVKIYPDGTLALRGVDFDLRKGEVHGLLGENGAGKTTLMKILSGLIKPTSGEIYIKGKRVDLKSPAHALKLGIGMIHQHLSLVPVFSAYENIVLGMKENKPSRSEVEKLMHETGLKVPLDLLVENLSFGVRQRIEILKMLIRNTNVLILDEPTTNLSPIETRELFKSLLNLKRQGKTIVLITHKIKEVLEVTDRITVLRRGRVVSSVETAKTNPIELAKMMVGREIVLDVKKPPCQATKTALKIEDLFVMGDHGTLSVKGISFDVKYGEIFGIAGVEGNGQLELAEAIAGLRKIHKGRILIEDKDITHSDVRERYKLGLSYIPEDRRVSLAMDMSILDNSVLTLLCYRDEFKNKFGILRYSVIGEHASKIVNNFHVILPSFSALARTLSGGNQQRLIVGREIVREPKIVLASQPTRGLDIAATEYIRRLLIEMRVSGKAILLISSDLDEVMALSDRMAVLYEGKIMGIVDPEEVTEEEVGLMMGGYTYEQVKAMRGG